MFQDFLILIFILTKRDENKCYRMLHKILSLVKFYESFGQVIAEGFLVIKGIQISYLLKFKNIQYLSLVPLPEIKATCSGDVYRRIQALIRSYKMLRSFISMCYHYNSSILSCDAKSWLLWCCRYNFCYYAIWLICIAFSQLFDCRFKLCWSMYSSS